MRISKLELFPLVAPQPQTTKLQGILNEYIKIGVVPLGCPPTPNYKTTADLERETFRVVEGTAQIIKPQDFLRACIIIKNSPFRVVEGTAQQLKLQNHRTFGESLSKLELFPLDRFIPSALFKEQLELQNQRVF